MEFSTIRRGILVMLLIWAGMCLMAYLRDSYMERFQAQVISEADYLDWAKREGRAYVKKRRKLLSKRFPRLYPVQKEEIPPEEEVVGLATQLRKMRFSEEQKFEPCQLASEVFQD